MIKGLFLGLFCFLLFLSHIFVFHGFSVRRKFFTIALFFSGGLFVYTLLFLFSPGDLFAGILPAAMPAFLNGAFLHFFFWYFYIHSVQIMDRSVATRIMAEIEKSASGQLTHEEIARIYRIDEKVAGELEDMVMLGRLVKDGDKYRLTPRGRLHSALFKAVRNYMKLRRS